MRRVLMLVALLAAASVAGWGISIPIPNYSFETNPNTAASSTANYLPLTSYSTTPPTDYWFREIIDTNKGAGYAGPRPAVSGLSPTDGSVMAGIGANSALHNSDVSLTPIGGSLIAGEYRFTFDIGLRSDQPRSTPYSIEIWGWDGSNVSSASLLGSFSGYAPSTSGAVWNMNQAFSFVVAANNPTISKLQIRLINLQPGSADKKDMTGTSAYQVNFDNLRLEWVPEPSTYALMGTVGLALYLLRRRKAAANK